MEQERDIEQGPGIYETPGDMVDGNGDHPIPGIRIDLDKKIARYLNTLHVTAWPMEVFYLNRKEEREEAEVWIKELIGKVLNA